MNAFKCINSLLSLSIIICFSVPVWADDPDFSTNILLLPKVSADKLITPNKAELDLEFTATDCGNFTIKQAYPEYIIQARTLMPNGQAFLCSQPIPKPILAMMWV